MNIFIDESGDPGFKIEQGSSRFFVVALVVFDDLEEIDKIREALTNLKTSWNKKPGFEFKFSKSSQAERLQVLQTAAKFNFKVRAVVFDKVKMNELQLEHFTKNYYQYALRSLLQRTDSNIKQAYIKIDSFGESYYRHKLEEYFKKYIGQGDQAAMKKLIFQDSKYDVLLQLADCIAGSLRKSFDGQSKDAQVYRQVFENKEEDIKVFKSVLHTHKFKI